MRNKLLSELGEINSMSILSASSADTSTDDGQVDGALAGPMRVTGERMDTLTYP